jgi:hypothetical protein
MYDHLDRSIAPLPFGRFALFKASVYQNYIELINKKIMDVSLLVGEIPPFAPKKNTNQELAAKNLNA